MPGAVHVFWRDHLDEHGAFRPADEVRALYESRGVTPDKGIIAFCQGGYRSANTFLLLKALGYPDVRNYVGSWAEWGNRDDSFQSRPDGSVSWVQGSSGLSTVTLFTYRDDAVFADGFESGDTLSWSSSTP